MQTQLALVSEVKVALLTLQSKNTNTPQIKERTELLIQVGWIYFCASGRVCNVSVTYGVRFLSSVDAQVALERLQVAEAGSTGVTGVGFLTSVDQDVGPEVGNLRPGQSKGKVET